MKKQLLIMIVLFVGMGSIFGQAVSDRNIIPVAVNLNQVLRMTITNGGNIEFVFNTIDEYKNGISGDVSAGTPANTAASEPMYKTDFTVASSTRWKITYGSEQATFVGVDNPANTGLALDNVGFTLVSNGTHIFDAAGKNTTAGAELWSAPILGTEANLSALEAYPGAAPLIEDNDDDIANAGDVTDNSFTITWRCGTAEAGAVNTMNAEALIEQSIVPDRYVTNVLFELSVDN